MKGEADPTFPYCTLVPVARRHASFKVLDPQYNFMEDTYYRFNKKTHIVQCLVTVMPDGSRIAWDTCRACSRYHLYCSCKNGIRAPRSVEYIYDAIKVRSAGAEWGMSHPDYRGSLTRAERERRAAAPQRFVMPDRAVTPAQPVSSASAGRTGPRKLLRKADVTEQQPKKLLRKAAEVVDVSVIANPRALRNAATESINQMTKELLSGPTKRLRKASAPAPQPKRILRKR